MYLLEISYTQPVAQVEPHFATHGAWVKKYIDHGTFVFAGPKKSGLGGVIVSKSIDKATLSALIAEDSFVLAGVAEYHVVDFECRVTAPALDAMKVL